MYLVISGDFEMRKKIKNIYRVIKNRAKARQSEIEKGQITEPLDFDMMEFLPHTKNKTYVENVKCERFIKAVSNFKSKKHVNEYGGTLRVMIVG